MSAQAMQQATDAAQAVGKDFVIGVRPHNGSWFAHCDDVEFDGSNPAAAIRSVIDGLRSRADRTLREAERTVTEQRRVLEALPATKRGRT